MTVSVRAAPILDSGGMLALIQDSPEEFIPEPITEQHKLFNLFNRLPFFTSLTNSFSAVGKVLANLLLVIGKANVGVVQMGKAFGVSGIIADGFNFLRIPFLLLSCYILGVKPPLTLSNSLKMAYTATVFGLGLAALLVSPLVSPYFTFAVIVLTALSCFTSFVYIFYQRNKLNNSLFILNNNIAQGYCELNAIKQNAASLDVNSDNIQELFKRFQDKRNEMQYWSNERLFHEKKLKARDTINIVDKGVSAGLSLLAFVGAAVFTLSPAVGLIMIGSSGASGFLYVLCRGIITATRSLFNRQTNEAEEKPEIQQSNENSNRIMLSKLDEYHLNPKAQEQYFEPDKEHQSSFCYMNAPIHSFLPTKKTVDFTLKPNLPPRF